eukprot:9492696-Pyramimonas_sp.AAC.1
MVTRVSCEGPATVERHATLAALPVCHQATHRRTPGGVRQRRPSCPQGCLCWSLGAQRPAMGDGRRYPSLRTRPRSPRLHASSEAPVHRARLGARTGRQ